MACQVLSFEAEVWLLKEQKQSDMQASETHEKTLLEKYKVWRTKFNLQLSKRRKQLNEGK